MTCPRCGEITGRRCESFLRLTPDQRRIACMQVARAMGGLKNKGSFGDHAVCRSVTILRENGRGGLCCACIDGVEGRIRWNGAVVCCGGMGAAGRGGRKFLLAAAGAFFHLFLVRLPHRHASGDVAEWSKAHPC
jgi:hypothetical protein